MSVRVGCFSGFWGDSTFGAAQLVKGGNLDYLVGDYLAEVTMGILARQRKTPKGGYVAEFVTTLEPLLSEIVTKKIKVVTNAGAMNPLGLKQAIEEVCKKAGLNVVVAAVVGDDLTDEFPKLLKAGKDVTPFDILGEEDDLPKRPMMSCNVYTGAFAVSEALAKGAQIVVTGRAVDSALVVGPLIKEFGWKAADFDLLAAGSVAGHIIECGCHATGGNFTDWEQSYSFGWDNVGYPIAEVKPDGTFVISKPPKTGGIVTTGTVCEQLVYEIHDPAAYILPDVIVDFTQVKVKQLTLPNLATGEGGSVLVTGAKGRPPTSTYKASVTYLGGFKMDAVLMIGGIDAKKKAFAVADGILTRTRRLFQERGYGDYSNVHLEALGAETSYGPNGRMDDSREVLLRIATTHSDKRALALLSKELSPSALSMAPGITGSASGRPKFVPYLMYRSCLINKSAVSLSVHIGTEQFLATDTWEQIKSIKVQPLAQPPQDPLVNFTVDPSVAKITVPLIKLCQGRSGDKGDCSNIGIICRHPQFYKVIGAELTEEKVAKYLSHLVNGQVKRYEVPGIYAYNFVCTSALGGGGLESLKMDRQGKCYAQQLLDFPVTIPRSLLYLAKL
eukprot:TRINITY_DN4739_c0_g1_i1.p1 TRINITY_DN4739_c0_g1~~TRINITY_DN4739_c0_g1_i1.p1  ORF type:complete len:615 (-),score=110.50 TRINITY_DN4739_c0_g1_i1:35-1879(-)